MKKYLLSLLVIPTIILASITFQSRSSSVPVGSVIHSLLTEAQFQATMGSGWVLADGRNVSGSAYQSITGNATIPDMRGRFLRGKNNGSSNNPDGDLALGAYTADKLGSHSHGVNWTAANGGVSSGNFIVRGTTAQGSFSNSTDGAGSNETAPKNITTNIFVRIN